MTTVVMTGATGLVGGALARALRARGDEVVAAVRRRGDDLDAIGVTQHVVDLTDADALHEVTAEGAVLVHAAAGVGTCLDDARVINRDLTRTVVEVALRRAAARLVHVSTTAVYDLEATGDAVVGEDAPLVTERDDHGQAAVGPYALTKAEAEAEVARAAAAGLRTLVLRPPAVLGPGPSSTWGTRVPRMLAEGGSPLPDPDATFGFVAIDDLTAALLAGIDAAATGTLNVVGGHVPVGAYLDAVAAFTGGPTRPSAPPERPGWRGRYTTDRLPAVLGLHPEVGFERAMAGIARAWPRIGEG